MCVGGGGGEGEAHLKKMLEVIRESISEWASAPVLVSIV